MGNVASSGHGGKRARRLITRLKLAIGLAGLDEASLRVLARRGVAVDTKACGDPLELVDELLVELGVATPRERRAVAVRARFRTERERGAAVVDLGAYRERVADRRRRERQEAF